MKFKLLLVLLVAFGIAWPQGAFCATDKKVQLPNSFIYQAISKYKGKNYTGCIQDMDYAIKNNKTLDIAFYYKGLSYAKLGMTGDAKDAYLAAINTTKSNVLKEYAKQGVSCIDDPSTCDSSLGEADITTFIKSNKFLHPDVERAMKEKAMERIHENINNQTMPDQQDIQMINQNNQPTDKEIADAVRTFQKMGMNPFAGGSNNAMAMYGQNQDMMQLSAMFSNQGNNNNNSMMNLIPMISAMQTSPGSMGSNKEFIQAYMLNQMLPGFNFQNNDK